ncbi:MAG: pyridoxamine 5'-phosphate oxidase family protein [Haloferacaceae archaeon]
MERIEPEDSERTLRREPVGALGLATADGTPYVIPMSFGYHGESLYFQMESSGRKIDLVEENPRGSLMVVSYPEEGVSESVVVAGRIEPVPADEESAAFAALADNAEFGGDLTVWGVPLAESSPRLYALRPESMSGRRFESTF